MSFVLQTWEQRIVFLESLVSSSNFFSLKVEIGDVLQGTTVDAGQTLLNWRKVFSCSFLKQNVTQDLWHETDVEIGESYMRI